MRRWLWILLLLPVTLGFRVLPGGNGWWISPSDPTLWVRSCRKLAFTAKTFPSGDPLSGSTMPTYDAALQSIFDDYNNIPGSFVRLAAYPDDPANPPAPATGDTAFTIATAEKRTIDICFGSQTFTGGHASPEWNSDGQIVGCEIEIATNSLADANDFVSVLTHEIGHCLGLDHPQDTDDAAMSYFGKTTRLLVDDRMGLVHLYPQEASYGKEKANLGLSCAAN